MHHIALTGGLILGLQVMLSHATQSCDEPVVNRSPPTRNPLYECYRPRQDEGMAGSQTQQRSSPEWRTTSTNCRQPRTIKPEHEGYRPLNSADDGSSKQPQGAYSFSHPGLPAYSGELPPGGFVPGWSPYTYPAPTPGSYYGPYYDAAPQRYGYPSQPDSYRGTPAIRNQTIYQRQPSPVR